MSRHRGHSQALAAPRVLAGPQEGQEASLHNLPVWQTPRPATGARGAGCSCPPTKVCSLAALPPLPKCSESHLVCCQQCTSLQTTRICCCTAIWLSHPVMIAQCRPECIIWHRQRSGAGLFVFAVFAVGLGLAYRSWHAGKYAPDFEEPKVLPCTCCANSLCLVSAVQTLLFHCSVSSCYRSLSNVHYKARLAVSAEEKKTAQRQDMFQQNPMESQEYRAALARTRQAISVQKAIQLKNEGSQARCATCYQLKTRIA